MGNSSGRGLRSNRARARPAGCPAAGPALRCPVRLGLPDAKRTDSAQPGAKMRPRQPIPSGLRHRPPRHGAPCPPRLTTAQRPARSRGTAAGALPARGRGESRRRAVLPATHLLLPPGHVCGLLGVEGVRDASHHEDVELQADPPLLLLVQLPLGLVSPLTDHRGARAPGSDRATAARAPRRVPPPFPSRGGQRSLRTAGRRRHLAALLFQPLVRLLFAGGRVQHGARAAPPLCPRPRVPHPRRQRPRGSGSRAAGSGGRGMKGKLARAFRTRRVRLGSVSYPAGARGGRAPGGGRGRERESRRD